MPLLFGVLPVAKVKVIASTDTARWFVVVNMYSASIFAFKSKGGATCFALGHEGLSYRQTQHFVTFVQIVTVSNSTSNFTVLIALAVCCRDVIII